MKKANQDIRKMMEINNIYYWEVAEKLHLHDSNFSRMLRKELSEENKIKVISAIKQVEADRLSETY